VIEAAIRGDGTVDAMNEPHVRAGEATEPAEVEVERVEEAHARAAGDPVQLDGQPAALELAHESSQELVPAAGRRRRELVEDREVGAAVAPPHEIRLGSELARDRTGSAPQPKDDSTGRHAARARRSAASDSRRPSWCV